MEGLTCDTGALVAAERSDRIMWSVHRAALRRGLLLTVPVGVLAEGWRGRPQANLSRLLQGCDVEDLTRDGSCRRRFGGARNPRRHRRRIRRGKRVPGGITLSSPQTRAIYARSPRRQGLPSAFTRSDAQRASKTEHVSKLFWQGLAIGHASSALIGRPINHAAFLSRGIGKTPAATYVPIGSCPVRAAVGEQR